MDWHPTYYEKLTNSDSCTDIDCIYWMSTYIVGVCNQGYESTIPQGNFLNICIKTLKIFNKINV